MTKLPSSSFPRLDHSDVILLGKAISREAIKTALFDMALLKASGSDCLHALFF